MSSLVFSARSITTFSTSNNAADAQHEKRARENASHHHFRQPAAHRTSNINSRNRAQQQSNKKTIVDITKLQVSQSRNRYQRNRMSQIRTDHFRAAKLWIQNHKGRNADSTGADRGQRHHDPEHNSDNG